MKKAVHVSVDEAEKMHNEMQNDELYTGPRTVFDRAAYEAECRYWHRVIVAEDRRHEIRLLALMGLGLLVAILAISLWLL